MHPAPNLTCFICSTCYSQAILEQNPQGLRAINHVLHRALFILIWTQINAISRELKFWHLISRKKQTLSLKFRSTLILKFISPKKQSCQISKARKLTCLAFCLGRSTRLRVAPITEVVSSASKDRIEKVSC